MTDYTDLVARLRNGSDGSPEAEAADAIEAMQAALDCMGVLEFFEQSRRDATTIAALQAEVARLVQQTTAAQADKG